MITSIQLRNFRSYEDSSFEFEQGVNIIVGPNASGKTNIIESIMIASTGGGYRGRDINMIMHDKDWARLELIEDSNPRVVKLQRLYEKVDKTIVIDGVSKKRMPKNKLIPSVLFEPNHLLMFHGGPELRREYLDTMLTSLYPEFSVAKNKYKRTVSQRNSLLHRDNLSKDELFIWNLKLSELGGVIASYRLELINELQQILPEIYSSLASDAYDIRVSYLSKCSTDNYASSMLKALEASFELDVIRKHTTIGPHRDDMEVLINRHNVRNVASRGEVRTLILACKIFETNKLYTHHNIRPIIMLDDVFSELDGARRQSLTSYLSDSQVFITTTDADVVIQHFLDKSNIIPLG